MAILTLVLVIVAVGVAWFTLMAEVWKKPPRPRDAALESRAPLPWIVWLLGIGVVVFLVWFLMNADS